MSKITIKKDVVMNAAQILSKDKNLVRKIARRYVNEKNSFFEDLMQEGYIGYLTAIGKYNPDRGAKLSTFASYWIRQSIGRAWQKQSSTIYFPAYVFREIRDVEEAKKQLVVKKHREPTAKEIAKYLDKDESEIIKTILACSVLKIRDLYSQGFSSKTEGAEQSNFRLIEVAPDVSIPDPEQYLILKEENMELMRAMDKLKELADASKKNRKGKKKDGERMADIAKRVSGVLGEKETLEEVGRSWGIGRERVNQIYHDALSILRKNFPELRG